MPAHFCAISMLAFCAHANSAEAAEEPHHLAMSAPLPNVRQRQSTRSTMTAAVSWVRRAWTQRTSTPSQLFAIRAALVVLVLLFGVLGAFGADRRSAALTRAELAAQQLIQVQEVRVGIVRADSIASSSYLVGGQEDPSQRAAYLDAVEQATTRLVEVAAQVGAGDRDSLAAASTLLSQYTGLVEQARANNRQGFPVGAAYQREANALVNSGGAGDDVLAELRGVEASQRRVVNDQLAAAHRAGVWMVLTGLMALAALVAVVVWMAWRFRRTINVPLVIAAGLVGVVLIFGGSRQATAISAADDAVGSSLQRADRVAQARAAAFDARSSEALTLINRGNGAAYEQRWQESSGAVRAALVDRCDPDSCLSDLYEAYATTHIDVRALDDGGDWEKAVQASLGAVDADSGNAATAFTQFADASKAQLDGDVAQVTAGLSDARRSMSGLRVLAVLAGIVAAALAAAGVGARLREYR